MTFLMLGRFRLAMSVLLLPTLFGGCDRLTSLEVKLDDLPVCTDEDIDNWNFANAKSLGVRGVPADMPVGFPAAKKGGNLRPLGGNWYPRDGYRHTMCGVLDHYGQHKAPWISGEQELDWNLFMLPSSPYAYTITEAAVCPLDGGVGGFGLNCDKWISCGTRTCIEAEATPPTGFRDNTWFPLSDGAQSPLVGNTICVNGPWVGEWLHGLRPEIHPSEMLWWRDREFTYMLLVQDDSSRFDKRSHFENPPEPGTSPWTPWAKPPLTYVFHIPFFGYPGRPFGTVSIFSEDAANVVSDTEDVTTGRTHGLKVDDELILRVHELNPDGAIQVGFERLCRAESSVPRIFGEVTLKSTIGVDTDGNEGYQLAKFAARWQRLPDDVGPAVPDPIVDPNLLAVNVDVDEDELAATTISSLGLQPQTSATVALTDRQGNSLEIDGVVFRNEEIELPLVISKGDASSRIEISSLPLVQDSVIVLSKDGEELLSVTSPSIGLSIFDEVQHMQSTGPGDRGWTDLLQSLGTSEMGELGTAEKLNELSVTLHTLYGMYSSGYTHAEDTHPISAKFNAALTSRSKAQFDKLFGSENPLSIEWTYTATEAVSGASIDVTSASEEQAQVSVEYSERLVPNDTLLIRFSESIGDRIIEVRATAVVRDVFGNMVQHTFEMSNHVLRVRDDPVQIISGVFAGLGLSNVSDALLAMARNQEPSRQSRGEGVSSIGLLFNLIRVSGKDGAITSREFKYLVDQAQQIERGS